MLTRFERLLIPVVEGFNKAYYVLYSGVVPAELRDKPLNEILEELFAADNTGVAAAHGAPSMTAADETALLGYVDAFLFYDENGEPRALAIPLGTGWVVVVYGPGWLTAELLDSEEREWLSRAKEIASSLNGRERLVLGVDVPRERFGDILLDIVNSALSRHVPS